MRLRYRFSCVLAAITASGTVLAQEPTHMSAATHPARGQFYSRLLFSRSEFESQEKANRELSAIARLAYGIRATIAALFEAEFGRLSAGDRAETGLVATTAQIKYRLFKRDFGPLNTWMSSVFAGFTMPGDMDGASDRDAYPRGALASTAILGRHGANVELNWAGYDEEPDRFGANASYLYRVLPAEYSPNTRGAWYAVVESLNQFTDDGDSRSRVAVGLLYEARRWAWELSVVLPVEQRWPEEEKRRVTVGLRFLP